jgi:hypothetical protein
MRNLCLDEIFPAKTRDEVAAFEVRDNVSEHHHDDDRECTGEEES